MRPGLKLIQVPGAYYSSTLVGYIRHLGGDDWELCPGYVSIQARTWSDRRPLHSLAADGAKSDHIVSAPSAVSEALHRHLIKRAVNAIPSAWPTVARPSDWSAE